MLLYTSLRINPLINFTDGLLFKEAAIISHASYTFGPLVNNNLVSRLSNNTLVMFSRKVERLFIFTNNNNLNNAYIDSQTGVFLSAGIVLNFMNMDQKRFLNNRLRTWHNYTNALILLQNKPFVIRFADLYGNNSILLNKLLKSNILINWLHIRLFFNSGNFQFNNTRSIKSWINNKYYQLEVGERI